MIRIKSYSKDSPEFKAGVECNQCNSNNRLYIAFIVFQGNKIKRVECSHLDEECSRAALEDLITEKENGEME